MEATEVCVRRVPEGRRGRVTRTGHDNPAAIAPSSGSGTVPAPRHQPVPGALPGSRRKRRVAVAHRASEYQDPPQAVRRRSKDGGENQIDGGEWIDPDDIRPNQRTGRVIRGYWTMCMLRRLQRVSREIKEEHVHAADYLRTSADVARIGFSAPRDGMPVNALVYGPRLDFSKAAHSQCRAIDEFKRIWASLREQQQRMAAVILFQNHSVDFWCRAEETRTGQKPNSKIELGKLVGMMDHLAKFLDADIDAALQKGHMRA